jgi:Icc-related predicted phosphoesterase
MRILAVSDAPSRALDQQFDADRWRQAGIELVVGCGDLSPEYLDFLGGACRVPLFYVRGNHDDWSGVQVGEEIGGRVVDYRGIRFLGLDGSPWYNGGPHQYGDQTMALKLLLLRPALWLGKPVDVVVAHAAPQFCPVAYQLCPSPVGVNRPCPYWGKPDPDGRPHICQDASDRAHRGFESFRTLILSSRPRFFLHGHRHQTYGLGKRELRIGETRVIDTYGHVVLDV